MAFATKEQILDAAEKLITERGIDAVSLREITTAAEVNLAAVHYHFGSKEGLVQKVFERRIRPVNEARLRMLDQAERSAGQGPLEIECVLRALIEPPLRLYAEHERGPQFTRVCGRIYAERSSALEETFDELFQELVDRFRAACARALPQLPPEELGWRLHFAVGAMVHTLMESERLKRFSGGLCDPRDTEAAVNRLVSFCAAGMRAGMANQGVERQTEGRLEEQVEVVQ
jgi:AcrR family transcriptional regulator